LIEIVAKSGQPLSAQLAGVPKMVSTPEIRVDCPDDVKFDLVQRVAKHFKSKYKTLDIDGVRVIFADGWGLLRASNTQPVLVMRFEAANEHLLKQYQAEVEQVLESSRAGTPVS
jgi:phosphomannomutase / phosphoglucomutase